MSLGGYVKLHRKLREWEWYSEVNVKVVFLHCLILANFKDANWKGIPIKRGQFITTYSSLESELSLSVQQIRTTFEKLKKTKEIQTEATGKYLLVTLVKFDLYQSFEDAEQHDNNTIVTALQQDSNKVSTGLQQQRNKNKNNKEEKELEKGKEEGKEKDHLPKNKNSDLDFLKKQIAEMSQQIESLKTEKEKEKSSAKKEKEEVVGDAPPPTPPHKTDLDQAKNIPMWKFEILENQLWESTPEKVQKAFWSYCEMRQELESRGITTTAVLQNLKKVELFLKSNTAEIVISCLELAIEAQNKTFDPAFVVNRQNGANKSTETKKLTYKDIPLLEGDLNHLNTWMQD